MTQQVFVTYEPLDGLFTNVFTQKSEAHLWAEDSSRMGSKVYGPFRVPELNTPFEIVIQPNYSSTGPIKEVYVIEDVSEDLLNETLYGPYEVYESINEFESQV